MKVPSQFCGATMEDSCCSPASQNHNGQLAGGANVSLANNKHQGGSDNGSNGDAKDQRPQYSMPGILHFIQHEWARFELERSQWELDRAEFQVRARPGVAEPARTRARRLPVLLSLQLSYDGERRIRKHEAKRCYRDNADEIH